VGHVRPVQPRRSARSARQAPAGLARDLAAVSPVIGSVLILVITVLGIAGVLYWGAPMIERIQVQNAQAAMVGEFEDLRDSSRELSVPDHSRFPTVVIPRGQVAIAQGSRLMVTVDQDPTHTTCDFHVTNWADSGASKGVVSVDVPTTCASGTLQIYSVSGATLSQAYSAAITASATTATITPNPAVDFSRGDWMFRLTDGAATPTVYAQAWLHSGDDVTWSSDSTTGKRSVTFDDGAIFSQSQGTNFLERPPTIGDSAFGATYYGLWLRTLSAQSYSVITGAGSHQVYLSLIGNYDRVDTGTAYRLRFDMAGTLAQSWCNSLLSRNTQLTAQTSSYQAADASHVCAQITTDGVRAACYARVNANSCSSVGASFTFRFLHARIYTSLAV
jgi:hypothetical protein